MLALGLTVPVRAQTVGTTSSGWSAPDYSGSSVTVTYTQNGQTHTTTWSGHSVLGAMSAGTGASAQVSGTIRVTRTWVGSGPPPAKCYVKETANAGASAVGAIGGGPGGADDDGGGDTPVGTVSASDGLGDAPTTGVGSVTSRGSHLIQVDSSSGSITLSAIISASADSAGQPVNCQAGGGPTPDNQGFSWDFDSRAVAISSDIETSYYKSTDGDTGGSIQVAHQRNADGSMSVDSAVAWQDNSLYTQRGWAVNSIPFTANAAGFNSPVFSWSLQGQGALMYPTASTADYSLADPTGSDFPLSTSFTVNVTDSDGTTGANTYNVLWHLPAENWALAGTNPPVWQEAPLEGQPAYCGHDASVSGQWAYTEDINGSGTSLADMFAIGAGLVDPPWAAFVAAAGIAFAGTQPKDSGVTAVNFDQSWGDANSSFSPAPADGSAATMEQYKMSPKMLLQFQHQHYTADHYDQHGYAGPTSEDYDKLLRWDFAGDFTLVGFDAPSGG